MPKKLVLLTPALFERVIKSWRNEAEANDLTFEPEWQPHLDYARGHIDQPKPRYGIYVQATVDAEHRVRPPFDRFVHVNHKFPKTSHAEVRFVWSVTSPASTARRDGSGVADLIADYIICALNCTQEDHNSKALRIYLPDRVDHQAASIFARAFRMMQENLDPEAKSRVAKVEVRVVPKWLLLKIG